MIVKVIVAPVVVNSSNGKRESDSSKIGFVKICASHCCQSVLEMSSWLCKPTKRKTCTIVPFVNYHLQAPLVWWYTGDSTLERDLSGVDRAASISNHLEISRDISSYTLEQSHSSADSATSPSPNLNLSRAISLYTLEQRNTSVKSAKSHLQ